MIVWLDAQISPKLAPWLTAEFGLDAATALDLELLEAEDLEIFQKARAAGAVVMTKDRDFPDLLDRFGPPPQVIWLTCGNASNQELRRILAAALPAALAALASGEPLVEISDVTDAEILDDQ